MLKLRLPDPSPAAGGRIELPGLGLLFLAGAVLRLVLWHTQSIVSVDGTEYIRLAQEIGGRAAADSAQPYGYPFLIFLAHFFLSDWVTAARVVDLVAGLALIPLTWRLTRYFVPPGVLRLLPAAATAALPLTVRYSLTTMSEAPYLALLLAMFVLVCGRRTATAGVLGGLAYTVRPEALTAVAVVALFLLGRRRLLWRFLLGVVLVVGAYVVVQGVHRGVWTLSQKTINIDEGEWWRREPLVGETGEGAEVASRLRAHARSAVLGYPGRFVAQGAQLLRQGGWLVPVAALGGLAGGGALLGAGLIQALVTPVFSLGANPRFILPFLPFLWILAVVVLGRLRAGPIRLVAAGVTVACLAFTAMNGSFFYRVNEDGVYPELMEAGEWLRPYVGPGTIVYGRKPYTAFYAGATYRTTPAGSYDAILDEIVARGGDFLVVHQQVSRFFRPALLPLVEDKPVVWHESRLRPVYINNRYLDGRTLIYRIVREGGPKPLPSEKTIKKEIGVIDHSPRHFFHGVLAMRRAEAGDPKRWMGAAGEFAYAESQDPENAAAYNNRAWCLYKANRVPEAAESDARHAVDLDPGNPDYLDTLVRILKKRGKDRAAQIWEYRLEKAREARAAEATESPEAAPDTTKPGN